MLRRLSVALAAAVVAVALAVCAAAQSTTTAPMPLPRTATMLTEYGSIGIELFGRAAPLNVAAFVRFARFGNFSAGSVSWYRYVTGPKAGDKFVLQGGINPNATCAHPVPIENAQSNFKYTFGVARGDTVLSGSPDTAFFINLRNNSEWLGPAGPGRKTATTHGYSVFGRVTSGFGVLSAMEVQPTHAVGGGGGDFFNKWIAIRRIIVHP